MDEDIQNITKEIRITISQLDPKEILVANYMIDSVCPTKQLAMTPWQLHYLPRILMDSDATDKEVLEATWESVCQLRCVLAEMIGRLEIVRGLELPGEVSFSADAIVKPTKPKTKSEKKPAKPKTPPKSKVVEDDDEDWAEDDPRWGNDDDEHFFKLPPPMIIDLTD